jgi:hypothetical protein
MSWKRAATMAAQLTLYEKLDAARDANDRLRDERDDMRAERDTLRAEVTFLNTRIKELEKQASTTKHVVREKNAVWVEEGETRDGPYCQTCYGDEGGKLIALNLTPQVEGRRPVGSCGKCKSVVYLVDATDVQARPEQSIGLKPYRGQGWVERWKGG